MQQQPHAVGATLITDSFRLEKILQIIESSCLINDAHTPPGRIL